MLPDGPSEYEAMGEDRVQIHGISLRPGEGGVVEYLAGHLPSGHPMQAHIHVFRGLSPGPSLLLLAGMHGDEVNGVELLRRALEERMFEALHSGMVLVAPLLNVFGFIHYARDLPDGKDINRSFPGSPRGSLAARLAWHITDGLLPLADLVIDFHTGGGSRYNIPQVRLAEDDPASLALAEAFGAPFVVFKPLIEKSLRETAVRMGKAVVVYEAGESLRYDKEAIEVGLQGIRNVLTRYGLSSGNPGGSDALMLRHSTWIRARQSGLFLWDAPAGMQVQKGAQLGVIHDPHGREAHPITAPRDGYLIGHNNAAVVHLGDALFHLAWT